MSDRLREFELLLKVSSVLAGAKPLTFMLTELLHEILTTLAAERGFVVLKRSGRWTAVASHFIDVNPHLEPGQFSRTLVDHVASDRETCLIANSDDCDFNSPSLVLSGIRCILCAPMIWDGEVQGAVYVDKRLRNGAFQGVHRELLAAIAQQASRTLQTAWLQAKLQESYQESAFLLPSPEDSRTIAGVFDRLVDGLETADGARLEKPETSGHDTGDSSAQCRIYLFGPLRVEAALGEGDWKSKRDRELLAYLALYQGSYIHEERLMEMFWPGKPAEKARHSLHNSITQIRKLLGCRERRRLKRQLDCYSVTSDCWTDVEAFRQTFREGRELARGGDWERALPALHEAERLAQRPFLEGMEAEWVPSFRYAFTDDLSECRTLLADYFHSRGKHLLALEGWRRLLDQDPCHERACQGAVEALVALGRRSEASRLYQTFAERFERELDLPVPFAFEM